MKYTSTLIAVTDMEKSKLFYHDVLGLNVTVDFGANVTLDGGIALQTLDTWKGFIQNDNVLLGNNASELYFEEDDMDAFLAHLATKNIVYVHQPLEHGWGQRVVRFHDPDKHIIEVGENMVMVVKRFADRGMTDEQVAARMDVPVNYVRECLKKQD
jgi:catechol 2,3-dioxygenase-like lactoylglutathione lyase family enzyme